MTVLFPERGMVGVAVVLPSGDALTPLAEALGRIDAHACDLVAWGGTADDLHALWAALPPGAQDRLIWVGKGGVFSVAPDGSLTPSEWSEDRPLLGAFEHDETVPEDAWTQAVAASAVDRARLASARDAAGRVGERVPWVTRGLAAILAAVFLVEMTQGGDPPIWLLRRLGALDVERLADGAWWLLASPMFLHGDVTHLLFNGLVLWSLGRRMEQILGSAPFVVLYGAAGLVGSAVSASHLGAGQVSVGASGALWGLLVADAVLTLSPRSPLPESLRRGASRAVLFNLVLNVLVSFRPNVDWAAHLGGGIVGLLIGGAVLMGWGAPAWRPVAVGVAAFVLASMGAAWVGADLPSLLADGQRRVDVPEAGVSIEVPEIVADARVGSAFGDLARDPLRVDVTPASGDDPVRSVAVALMTPDAEVVDTPGPRDGAPGVVWGRVVLADGWVLEAARSAEGGVDVLLWPDQAVQYEGIAATLAASLEPL